MNELNIARVVPVAEIGNPIERLGILFDGHYDRLYRLARRLTASADDALDLVQETFLKAARYPISIPVGFRNEEAWLVRVLVNIRRDQWREILTRSSFEATAFGKSPLEPADRALNRPLLPELASGERSTYCLLVVVRSSSCAN
jgi:DNA-directed RNA polymerase specialized sigma24 family protein